MTGKLVCIVDDDESVRESLGELLGAAGYTVETFDSAARFLSGDAQSRCACLITDIRMPQMDGQQLFAHIKGFDSDLPVILVTGHGDIPMAVQAIQDGAFGWLEKPCNDERLLDSVALALRHAGERAARKQARRAAQALWDKLTPRERQVARLVAEGKPNKQIALELAPLEQRTVETHRANAFAKLGVANSHQLDRFLREHGL